MTRKEICIKLRKQLEKLVEKGEIYATCSSYNLDCCCGIASFALNKAFNMFGYESKMVSGEFGTMNYRQGNHCWVESEGYVYDLTATQFEGYNHKPIFISKKGKSPYRIVHNDNIKHLKYFKEMDWPPDQSPNKKIVNKILQGILKNEEN